jgi:hypothetical protein
VPAPNNAAVKNEFCPKPSVQKAAGNAKTGIIADQPRSAKISRITIRQRASVAASKTRNAARYGRRARAAHSSRKTGG